MLSDVPRLGTSRIGSSQLGCVLLSLTRWAMFWCLFLFYYTENIKPKKGRGGFRTKSEEGLSIAGRLGGFNRNASSSGQRKRSVATIDAGGFGAAEKGAIDERRKRTRLTNRPCSLAWAVA